jgi:tetratricopeptide (TPR) repeat protein
MNKLFLFAFLFVVSFGMSAQYLPDSLEQRFASARRDSNLVNEMNTMATGFLKSNPNITRSLASRALEIAPTINYTRGYARALTVMGNSYWYEGIYEFAQNYYLLAARSYQSIPDSTGLGQTFNNIGEVYKKLKEPDKAITYLARAEELLKKDQFNRSMTLYNIGELYIATNRLDEGLRYTEDALAIAKRENNKRVIAFCYWSFGAIKQREKDYPAALQHYFTAEKHWTELGEIRSMIQTYQEITELYSLQGRFDEAEKYLKKSMDLAKQIRVADLQVNNYLHYARLDSLRGRYQRSLYHLSRHNSLKDSVYNLLKAEQIARLQTIYEMERRDTENQQLRSEQELKNSALTTQRISLIAISGCLFLAGAFVWSFYQQRKRISLQKEAIEMQASALMKLNEALLELNKNLEARIYERTAQLTLQNQRLTEYTFVNAHKLRAPVASILGLIQLMQQSTPQEREIIIQHLRTCGEQLDNIIREVSRNLENAIVPGH